MVIWLTCGLGNQMFKYAYGRYMSCVCGEGISYNLSWYDKWGKGKRKYLLDYFNVIAHITTNNPTCEPPYPGAWERMEFADPIKDLLIKELSVKSEFYTDEYKRIKSLMDNDSIGMHIRMGDLLTLTDVNIPTIDYYLRAYNIFKGGRVFIFSDDMKWCKNNFSFKDMVFVDIDDYLSFELLRLCPRKVIPMSTFSWWAAYLGGGDVITTKERKYKEGTAYSYIGGDELIPKTWKRI